MSDLLVKADLQVLEGKVRELTAIVSDLIDRLRPILEASRGPEDAHRELVGRRRLRRGTA